MRRVLAFIGLWLVLALAAGAEDITVIYDFPQPTLTKLTIGSEVYDWLDLEGADNYGADGAPCLPIAPARILLPAGTDVSAIRVVASDAETLGKGFRVAPTQRSYPLSMDRSRIAPTLPDAAIYTSDQPFPGCLYEQSTVQAFRGYSVLILRLYPVQYAPVNGEITYHERLTVHVTTKPGGRADDMARGLPDDVAEIAGRVDNPAAVFSYPTRFNKAGDVDMLIITTAGLAGAFAPLEKHHDSTGLTTEIVTTAMIGSNDPTALRDYIRTRYLNDGVSYVLIGGDHGLIPALMAWDPEEEPHYMPVDLYYGCLDGTWNYDGDAFPGEGTDGEGGGLPDLVAEVYVGRAAVDDVEQAARFVSKTLKYINNEGPYLEKTLILGEELGFGGPSEYATESMMELVDSSCAHGYCTYGIPDADYVIDTLLDSEDWAWFRSHLINSVGDGVHIIEHLGHCNFNYAFKMYSHQIDGFRNSNHFFAYSQGCYPGAFDYGDCWAEIATGHIDEGAFALVMNCRYGLGKLNSTNSPAQKFNRRFWDQVFNPVDPTPQLGRALQNAKETWLQIATFNDIRYTYYEQILFGDPSIALKRERLMCNAENVFGAAPLEVSFETGGWTGTYGYLWDFGDGGHSDEIAPTHVYHEPGVYDVKVVGFTPEGTVIRTKTGVVAVVADTLHPKNTVADTARGTVVDVCLTNHIPVRRMVIPVDYSGDLALDLDSVSTVGCRTEGILSASFIHWAYATRMATLLLETEAEAGSGGVPAGSGPILRLHFSTQDPVKGQSTDLSLAGYGLFVPECVADYGDYQPSADVGTVRFSGCCTGESRGDVDCSGLIDIVDLLSLVKQMYDPTYAVICADEADVNGTGDFDITDLVFMVNFMFRGGPTPEACP